MATRVARLMGRAPYQERLRLLIARHAPGRSFLDVGCMWKVDGAYAFLALDVGAAAVTGVDLRAATDPFNAENSRRSAALRFVEGDINDANLTRALGTFDVVFCSGVLYHVPNPLLTLARLRSVCSGTMILGSSTIAEQPTPQAAVYYPYLARGARDALNYRSPGYEKIGLDTAYRPEWDYSNYFWGLTPSCVEAMLRTVGFDIIERYTWRHALCVVCEAAATPPNFATFA